MKQVKIGGEKIDIQATPYSLVVHESEFGSDLIEDTMKLSAVMVSERVNGLLAMRITYTLAKTAALIKNSNQIFPEFNAWLMGIAALDLGNADMYSEVIDEIQRKLFRSTEIKQEEEFKQSVEE